MEDLVRKNIQEVKPYVPGKPLEELQRELGLKEIVKLASNENPLGVSPKAKAAMKEALDKVNRYPDGNCFYLKVKLSKRLKVAPENIIFGNGSNEIIELIIKTFLNEGENVIVSEPDFLIFKLITQQEAGKSIEVKLKHFYCDLNAISEAITEKTKIIFIANPNNPTGTYVKEDELKNFINQLPNRILVVLDEAYYEFAKGTEGYPESMQFLERPNVIILRTFSKAYGLSGLRLGFGLANKEAISSLNKARQPFNVNYLAQVAGCAALDDEDFLIKTVKTVQEGKLYIYKELNRMGLKYIPSATNFILIDVKRECEKVFQDMLKVGVIVRDMQAYKLKTYIRVTIGRKDENEKFISALEKVLKVE